MLKVKNNLFSPTVLAGVFNFFLALVSSFFLTVFLKDYLHFSGGEIGILYAGASAATILSLFPVGIFNDRLTPRKLIILGLLLTALFYGGFLVFKSFLLILLIFILGGCGRALVDVSTDTLLQKTRKERDPGVYFGVFNLFRSLAIAFGFILGGILLFKFDFYLVFLLVTIVCLLLIFYARQLELTESTRFEAIHYGKDLLQPHILAFLLTIFIFALHWGAETTSYGLFLKENLSLNRVQMGLYMSVELFVLGFTAYFLGKRLDNKKTTFLRILMVGLLASGVGHIFMTYPQPYISVFFRGLHGFGDGAIFLFMYLGIAKFFKVERIGGSTGALSFVLSLGAITGALIFGPLGEKFGYNWPLIISGAGELVILLIVILAFRELIAMKPE